MGEIARLRAEIARHDRLYFQDAAPEITDAEYDALVRRLAALEAEQPGRPDDDSPTRRVGSDRDLRFPSAPHSRPMLSLQNSYDLADVAAFDARVRKDLTRRAWSTRSSPRWTASPSPCAIATAVSTWP